MLFLIVIYLVGVFVSIGCQIVLYDSDEVEGEDIREIMNQSLFSWGHVVLWLIAGVFFAILWLLIKAEKKYWKLLNALARKINELYSREEKND